MGWGEIATEEAIEEAERAIAAMIGTLSNPHSDAFGIELTEIIEDLEGDGDRYTQLLGCVSAIAACGLTRLALGELDPLADDEEETQEHEAARRGIEMQYLDAFADLLRDLARDNP
jgi:hypothetical protein